MPRTNCAPLAALALQVGEAERASDPPARAAAINDLKLGVARTSRLVEQLLTMARLEPEGCPAICARGSGARSPTCDRRPRAARRGEGIDLGRTGTADVAVQGDAANLATLLANLLDNALRHTPGGGRIDVAIAEEEGRRCCR
jgi:signal transduction histidine kinase